MTTLEDHTRGEVICNVLPDALVTGVAVRWYGSAAIDLTYKDAQGKLGSEPPFFDEHNDGATCGKDRK
jgi:hypothetical protein